MKILLDYLFPITVIEPTPAASTAFLKQACLVCKPKSGQEGNVGQIYSCTSMTAVAARTDNTEAEQLFSGGMSKVYILLSDDLDLADALEANQNLFYTLLISSDFDDEDLTALVSPGVKATLKVHDIRYTAKARGADGDNITIEYVDDGTAGAETVDVTVSAIVVHMEATVSTAAQIAAKIAAKPAAMALIDYVVDSGDEAVAQGDFAETPLDGGVDAVDGAGGGLLPGTFDGVIGVSTQSEETASDQAAISHRCVFLTLEANGAQNLCFAFGKLLSNALAWRNQQYIPMPVDDEIETLGDAESLFDARISFAISDDEFGARLGFFVCGGKAITEPYIVKNLQIDMQSKALQYISGNQPAYTKTQAALLEDELQGVIDGYIDDQEIEAGTVEVTLEEDNFVAAGAINISEPKALWRIVGEMRQTL